MNSMRWSALIVALILIAVVAHHALSPAYHAMGPGREVPNAGLPETAQTGWEAPRFDFPDQHGERVSNESLRGRVWIADFFFTRCTSICPAMTARFVLLQAGLDGVPLRFVSFSVDPEHDSPAVLADYARQWNPAETRWHLLSTTPEGLARTAAGMRVAVHATGNAADPIFHTNRFLLVDAEGRVRGSYDSDDDAALQELQRDARRIVSGRPDAAVNSLAQRDGKALFVSLGCAACHADARLAPALGGLRGRDIPLDGGSVVVADAAYVEESIVAPWAKLAAGYGPTMPSYRALLDQRGLDALVEYVFSGELAAPVGAPAAAKQVVDPVCNMKVTATAATPSSDFAGRTYWFCCETCRTRFAADPRSFTSSEPEPLRDAGAAKHTAPELEPRGPEGKNAESKTPVTEHPEADEPHPLCPVCEMAVARDTPLRSEHRGRVQRFCSEGCKRRFDAQPDAFTGH